MKKAKRFIIALLCIVLCLCLFVACNDDSQDDKGNDGETPHTHDYSAWGHNETQHWKECPTDHVKDATTIRSHVDADSNGVCDDCGYEMGIPFSFTVAGSDKALDGLTVTITSGDNTFSAMIDNGKFTLATGTTVPQGTYVVSLDGYYDGTLTVAEDGTANAVTLNPIVDSVEITTIDGVPTLVVKGAQPATYNTVKLHAEGNSADLYWDNVSTQKGAVEFRAPLNTLPLPGTPWYFFHIYGAADANAENANLTKLKDLDRGTIATTASYVYDNVKYSVIVNGDSTQLVLQPTSHTIAIGNVSINQATATLTVTGTVLDGATVNNVKIHADRNDGNGKLHVYSDAAKVTDGAFTVTLNLTTLEKSGDWYWFHVYATKDETVTNDTDWASTNLAIDASIKNTYFDYTTDGASGTRFKIENQDQLALVVSETPQATVTSIAFDTTDGAKLVVEGTSPTYVPCIKLHASRGDSHPDFFGDNVSNTPGQFKLVLDLTEFNEMNEWYWTHIYVYSEATPSDNTVYQQKIDIQPGALFANGTSCENGDKKYTAKIESSTWNNLVIVPSQPAQVSVTSISVDQTTAIVTVTGTTNMNNIKNVVIHAVGNDVHYYGTPVAVGSDGTFTATFDLTTVPTTGTPWCFFHVYSTTDETATQESTWASTDIDRDTMVPADFSFTLDDVTYKVIGSQSQLTIQPNPAE